jgi:cytosol alanyl aminopeptidase
MAVPSWKFADTRVGLSASAMAADELTSTKPIRLPVTSRQDIETSFDGEITYAKGASVARMFEASVGKAKWQMFVQQYLRKHARGNVEAKDFIDALSEHLGPQVAAGFAGFLDKPGVPLVTAKIDCSTAKPTIALSQQRSLAFGTIAPAQTTAWSFPVCFRFGNGAKSATQCVQLAANSSVQTAALDGAVCPSWLLLNADARGYYRSAMDPKVAIDMLDGKTKVNKQAALTVAEQWMTIVDVQAAVTRGSLPVDQSLAMAPVVAAALDDRVAQAAPGLLAFGRDALDDA